MEVPKIEPAAFAKLEEYVKAALIGAHQSEFFTPREAGQRAAVAAIAAYAALNEAAGMNVLLKPGNPEWKQDPQAIGCVKYLLSVGLTHEDFLRAEIEAAGDVS